MAGWGDQRLDPNGLSGAARGNAQVLHEAYDEMFATCQTGGPSLVAGPPANPPSCVWHQGQVAAGLDAAETTSPTSY